MSDTLETLVSRFLLQRAAVVEALLGAIVESGFVVDHLRETPGALGFDTVFVGAGERSLARVFMERTGEYEYALRMELLADDVRAAVKIEEITDKEKNDV